MSAADVAAPAPAPAPAPVGTGAAGMGARRPVSTRLFRSELRLIYFRRRNWFGGLILAALPIIFAISIKTSGLDPGDGLSFLAQATGNGLFVALAAVSMESALFLPIAVACISADSVAGEANLGTLRYLLAVPVHRTRLLLVKYAAVVVFALSAVLLVAVVGLAIGLPLLGGGPLTTLSGTQLSFLEGLGRLALVCLYLTVCLAAFGAIGLFVSTLTEQPLGATIATVMLAIVSQILDNIPQLSAIHEYLPTHYWLAFGDLLRDPIATEGLRPGILSALAYTAIFTTAAWARFTTKDVSS